MIKKIFVPLCVGILVFVGALVYSYYGKDSVDTSNSIDQISTTEKCKVFTYTDKFWGGDFQLCIENIWIKGVYFVPKDQVKDSQPFWTQSVMDLFGEIKPFYEDQFDHKIKIAIDNNPIIIYGGKNISEYNSGSIFKEVHDQISNTFPQGNYFVNLQIFVVDGSGNSEGTDRTGLYSGANFIKDVGGSVNPISFLEPEGLGATPKSGVDYSGYLLLAHEFGHSLAIPHPWDEDVNKDENGKMIDQQYGNDEIGSVMSYGGPKGPLIPNSFIRWQVKQRMIRAN